MSGKAAVTKDAQKEDASKKLLEMLDEDDEFEEFEIDDWTAKKEEDKSDDKNWQDDWDDDLADEDFIGHLRKELKM